MRLRASAATRQRAVKSISRNASESGHLRNPVFLHFRTRTQALAGTRTRSDCGLFDYVSEYHFIEYELTEFLSGAPCISVRLILNSNR